MELKESLDIACDQLGHVTGKHYVWRELDDRSYCLFEYEDGWVHVTELNGVAMFGVDNRELYRHKQSSWTDDLAKARRYTTKGGAKNSIQHTHRQLPDGTPMQVARQPPAPAHWGPEPSKAAYDRISVVRLSSLRGFST